MANDYTTVKHAIKDSVREWFSGLREAYPDEEFYAVCLYTDGDFTAPVPTANSLARLQKMIQEGDEEDRWLYKWAPGEWPTWPGISLRSVQDAWDAFGEIEAEEPMPWDEPSDAFGEECAKRLAATIDGLKELGSEGFFGQGEDCVTVFFSISDSADAGWAEVESARRVNPPELFARFEPEQHRAAVVCYGEDANREFNLARVFHKLYGHIS